MEDIEDFIVLKGFTRDGRKLQLEAIERAINNDLGQRRARKAMEYAESGDRQEEETKDELTEQFKAEDDKRKFINQWRPHMRAWNFIEEDQETKVPHLLRATADPNAAYIDGRIADLLVVIEGLATHLRMHAEPAWEHLNKQTLAIFQKAED